MSFKNLNIKIKYDSDNDDLLNDFYIPILANAKKYYRLTGYFSSKVLAIAAQGMSNFIHNNGEMLLICSHKFSADDLKIIKETNDPQSYITNNFIKELDELTDEFFLNHLSALGWMIVNDKLKIKIAIPKENVGIFHMKIGILEDFEGNKISFSGSDNETAAGWLNNINVEEFKVFKSWENGEKYIQQDLKDFNKYWEDNANRTCVFDIPEAVKSRLIELAPEDINSLNLEKFYPKKHLQDIKLREYQNEAITNWFNNNCKGIFEMATGTGKTFTALSCFERLLDEKKELLTIIACPQSHLIDQWNKSLKNFYDGEVIICSSKNYHWKDDLKSLIINLKLNLIKDAIILTTHKTLSSEKFIKNMEYYKGNKFLIVDEVHGIGSEKQLDALIPSYNYRLGLSATPSRWFDEEGTEIIKNYFNDVVFEFNIKNALEQINPDTGKSYLTPYLYHPIMVDLNSDELESYKYYTQQIVYEYNSKNKDLKKIENLIFQRRKIVNNAESKYYEFSKLLYQNQDLDHCLIFCSERQMERIQKTLNKHEIPQHRFTSKESTIPSKKLNGLNEREYIIKKFNQGYYKAIVAIKCLDEGVDLPSAETGIILSSTQNPREHIQRRGRLLRRYPGKERAIIYDILVFPKDKSNLTLEITKKEIERYEEFAKNAENSFECLNILRKKIEEI